MTAFESVVERVRNALMDRCEVSETCGVVVACSGGADSVALAYALAACGDVCTLEALCFIDHGLRDVSTERDAVQQAAAHLGVTFRQRRVCLPAAGNLQSAARTARYAALEELAGPDALIATGHTQTDQAETLLQRVTRGTGIRGLQGIRFRLGRIIRPLLEVTREETRGLGFPYADDPSNVQPVYARNRMRLTVLPELRKENPQVVKALASLAVQAQDEAVLVDLLTDFLGEDACLTDVPSSWIHTLVRWRFRREFPEVPPPRRRALEGLVSHLKLGGPRRRFSLGQELRGEAHQGTLTFGPENDPRQTVVIHGPGAYVLGRQVIKVIPGPHPKGPREAETNVGEPIFQITLHPPVRWPLLYRPVRPGDRMVVSAEVGSESILELLKKRGVSPGSKTGHNALSDGLGHILWVPPLLESSALNTSLTDDDALRVTVSNEP